MPQYPELRGQTVVVTGGANGIGAASVRAFRAQGARVFFCDIDVQAGEQLARATGPECYFSHVDMQSEREIRHWISRIAKKSRRIHALINSAGRDPRIALDDMTAEEWDRLFATNVRAAFLMCRECVPLMRRGSAIVHFGSITLYNSLPQISAYVATKGALLAFTRSLARELGPKRIRVNTLSPGWTMTERQLRQHITPAVKKMVKRSQSIPDLITPEEIADVVVFLTSDASRAITGQEILVDRGWEHS